MGVEILQKWLKLAVLRFFVFGRFWQVVEYAVEFVNIGVFTYYVNSCFLIVFFTIFDIKFSEFIQYEKNSRFFE